MVKALHQSLLIAASRNTGRSMTYSITRKFTTEKSDDAVTSDEAVTTTTSEIDAVEVEAPAVQISESEFESESSDFDNFSSGSSDDINQAFDLTYTMSNKKNDFNLPTRNTAEVYKNWQPNTIEIPESTPARGYSNEDYLFQRLDFGRFDKIQYSKWQDPFPKYPEQDSSSDPDAGFSAHDFPKSHEEIQAAKPYWVLFDEAVARYSHLTMPNSNTRVSANSGIRPILRNAIPEIKYHSQFKKVVLNAYKTGDVEFVDEIIDLVKESVKDTPDHKLIFDDYTLHLLRPNFIKEDEMLEYCEKNAAHMDRWGPTLFNSLINYYEIRGQREKAEEYLVLGIKNRAFVEPMGTAALLEKDRRYAENACLLSAGFETRTYVTSALTKTAMYQNGIFFNFGFLDRLAINTGLRYCLRQIRDSKVPIPKRIVIQLAYPHDQRRKNVIYGPNICLQPWFDKLAFLKPAMKAYINSDYQRDPKSPYVIFFTKAQSEYIIRKLPKRRVW